MSRPTLPFLDQSLFKAADFLGTIDGVFHPSGDLISLSLEFSHRSDHVWQPSKPSITMTDPYKSTADMDISALQYK